MSTLPPTVLHYVGYDDDRGGIVSVVRALAATGEFSCILGVNTGFVPSREAWLPVLELPRLEGEKIGGLNFLRARAVARAVQIWLRADTTRVFHGHSRAGLLVALWLNWWGEQRVIVSVHCYGRQRWFYRWAAGKLGKRLFWLTPAMRRYYGVPGREWEQCIPSCIAFPETPNLPRRRPPQSVIVLGGVGSIIRWKGWHLLLEALATLPLEIRRNFRFVHIGSRQGSDESERYAQELSDRVKRAGLSEVVEWRGEQPSSTALLTEIDCLVLPSENEPFSLAMIEALFAGVPVVRADSGGAVDVIEPGVNGWLFRSGDSADLARVLRSLVETDALARVRIDREGLQRFSAPVVARQWAAVYARLSGVE
jgi:glycosyltransferase involved in cell wall biosynthesis